MTSWRRTVRLMATISVASLAAAALLGVTPQLALAGPASLISDTFGGSTTTSPNWYLPATPDDTDNPYNTACLTGGSSISQTPIPGCGSAVSPGALEFTSAGDNQEGGVAYALSLPTLDGIDATFDTYQFGGNGADGIVFFLAATKPSDPSPPPSIGAPGGALGYTATKAGSYAGGALNGMADAYLAIGFDAYGNFPNTQYEGSGCTDKAFQKNGTEVSNVTVRGPGSGTTGYCAITSTLTSPTGPTVTVRTTSGSNGSLPSPLPVEIVLNTTGTAFTPTSDSSASVPAGDFAVIFTPYGGSQTVLEDPLPDAASYLDPSWVNGSGIPYQLTFGWVASTGGSNDYHEVNQLTTDTLNGVPPQLSAAMTDSASGTPLHGATMSYSISVANDPGAAAEHDTLTATDTFPSGETPLDAGSGWSGGAGWTCATSGQTVTCTDSGGLMPGGNTGITIPVTVTAPGDMQLANSVTVSSDDADPASASDTVTVAKIATAIAASASPATDTFGSPVQLSATGLPPAATGTVTFSSGGSTLCTGTVSSGSVACATPAPTGVGSYTVTATYSGDPNYLGSNATTGFTLTPASTSFAASANPSSSSYGNTVQLAASKLSSLATGTITFTLTSDGTPLCTATVSSGSASCTTAVLTPATYPVTATYSGDANDLGSTATTSFAISLASTSFTASSSPASPSYGDTVQLRASGLPPAATGAVTFTMTSDGATLCAGMISSGSASCNTAVLAPATYPVTATYSGDGDYASSTTTTGFTIRSAPTSFTASASPTSTSYGNPVELSAAGFPAAATGSVAFTSGGTALCTGTVSSGVASCATGVLTPATHSVTATYSGDTDYASSTATTSFTITPAPTSFTASASPTSTSYGDTVGLSAAGFPVTATGSVTFTSGGTTLCMGTVSSGVASCATGVLTPATYPVTATYSGDADYASSTATTGFTITSAPTSFTASASPTSTSYGNSVELSAAGLPLAAIGGVTFTADGATLCAGTVSSGVASCSTSVLPPATYLVTATYSGDADYASSTATTGFTVTSAPTSFTAWASPARTSYGDTVELSAAGLPPAAMGSVAFTSGGATLCAAMVGAGPVSCTTAVLTPATYPVIATYSGDTDYASSTATTSITITPALTSLTASASPTSTSYGNSVELSAAVLPSVATGSVAFISGGATLCVGTVISGAASCATAVLTPAGYPVTATYSGDADYASSTATTTFTIRPDPALDLSTSGTPSGAAAGSSYALTLIPSLGASPGGDAHSRPTLVATLPAGEVFDSAPSVTAWNCALSAGGTVLTCTSSATLPISAGTSLSVVTVTVHIASTASGSLTTNASLADNTDNAATANASASVDTTPVPVLVVTISGAPSTAPESSTYTLTVDISLSASGGPAYNELTLTITLPTGETFAATPSLPGWSCPLSEGDTTVTCVRTAEMPINPGTSPTCLSVQVQVSPSASGNLILTAAAVDSADGATMAVATALTTVSLDAPGTPDTGAPAGASYPTVEGILLTVAGLFLIGWGARRRVRPSARRA